MKRLMILSGMIFSVVFSPPIWSDDGKDDPKPMPYPIVLVRNDSPAHHPTVKKARHAIKRSVAPSSKTATSEKAKDRVAAEYSSEAASEQATASVAPIQPPTATMPTIKTKEATVNPYLQLLAPVMRQPQPASSSVVPLPMAGNPHLQPAPQQPPPIAFFPPIAPPEGASWMPAPTFVPSGIGPPSLDKVGILAAQLMPTLPTLPPQLASLSILPDGFGMMHTPVFIKYIPRMYGDEKPTLLVEVSCPTKAIFGFNTPPIAAAEFLIGHVIEGANAVDVFPVFVVKVCK